MSFKRSVSRFAHVSGFSYTTYSADGKIITCGTNDGDVRIWDGICDDDPFTFCCGEKAFTCAQFTGNDKKDRLLVATDNNAVHGFFFPGGERDGIAMRFTAPPTAIKINSKWIAAGSEDFTIKVQKIGTSDVNLDLVGHEGPILHIDLSCKNELASSSGDGTIRIWSLENTAKVIKTFDGFEKANEFSRAIYFSTPSFDREGKLLAIPKGQVIQVIDTLTWEIKFKLDNNSITGKYTVCSFSHDGDYIAAGTDQGEISVWNSSNRTKLTGQYSGDDRNSITSIAFNPKRQEEFSFCDVDGQLSIGTVEAMRSNGFVADEAEEEEMEHEEGNEDDDMYGGIAFDDADDENNENCVSLAKLKNETLGLSQSSSDEDDDKTVKSLSMSIAHAEPAVRKPFLLQPPFQAGSTPTHLENRFMVWNSVGTVICHSSDENSIITEFHDVTIHPSLHILNNLKHELASLSSSSLALATKETPCRLVCIAFISSGSKEWSTTMPECEVITNVASGATFVAVATDAGLIRFFTTMGTQREVICVPGPVVTMAASDTTLATAYHTSNSSNKFALMITNIVGSSMVSRVVDLPIISSAKLLWIGFSDVGSIIAFDSTGRVISYNSKRNLFYPICEMNNHVVGASDNFFIISVSEKEQKIRATLCRGTSFPLTNPRPIVREIDYSLPLCYMETEKSVLEESLIKASIFDTDSSDKTIVEKGLKLFSSAMNSELESRAYEIVEMIANKKLIELAAKYASQKGRIHMANKISKLLMDFEEKEQQKEKLLHTYEVEMEMLSNEAQTIPTSVQMQAKETSTPIIAPRPMTSQKKSANPFKKSAIGSSSKLSTPTSSLSHLTNKSLSYKDVSNNSDDENVPTCNRSVTTDTPRPGNFSQWFIANTSDLRATHINATDKELMKIGRGVYKELTQKQIQPSDEQLNSSDQPSTTVSKRKLNLSKTDGGISKLAKFSFKDDE